MRSNEAKLSPYSGNMINPQQSREGRKNSWLTHSGHPMRDRCFVKEFGPRCLDIRCDYEKFVSWMPRKVVG